MIDVEIPLNLHGALAGDSAVWLEGPPMVCWEQTVRIRLNCYWIREPVRGSMGAELGDPVEGRRKATLRVGLQGPIYAVVRRADGRRLGLELHAAASSGWGIQVAAKYEEERAEEPPDLRLRLLGVAEWGGVFLRVVNGELPLDSLPRHLRQRLLELIPALETGIGTEQIHDRIAPAAALCGRIWRETLTALEQRYSAEIRALLARGEDSLLFEATFDPTEEGLAQCERARQGDFSEILAGGNTVVRHFPSSRLIAEDSAVELHLPYLDRTDWKFLIERLQSMEVRVDESGRVLAIPGETAAAAAQRWNFQQAGLLLAESLPRPTPLIEPRPVLAFSDQRRLSGPQARHALPRLLEALGFPGGLREALEPGSVDVRLTLATPANARPWLEAPRPRSPEFYEVFGAVSRALQRALRIWTPYVYFDDLRRFEDVEGARAMLVYQATRPSPRKAGTDLTYDVMNLESVYRALRTAGAVLPDILRSAHLLLSESDREETAAHYRRQSFRKVIQSVKRQPRWFQCLLTIDAFVVKEVIKLAMGTRTLQDDPAETPRRLHRLVEGFVEALHHRFRRLYGRFACLSLGSLVVVEAARALAAATGQPAPLQVILRLTPPEGPGVEHVLVNDGGPR